MSTPNEPTNENATMEGNIDFETLIGDSLVVRGEGSSFSPLPSVDLQILQQIPPLHHHIQFSNIKIPPGCRVSIQESWTILAKVIRLWKVSNLNNPDVPFSLEMLVMDDKGGKIHASVRRTLIYRFDKHLREGLIYTIQNFGVAVNGGNYRTCHHSYKLNFQFETKVESSVDQVRPSIYSFVHISNILSGSYDMDYLVDVMGMLTGVGSEREYEKGGKKTKLNVIAVDADGHKIECTLFGSFVDELSNFISSGEHQNAVVILQLAKVKTFQGKIHLQNCMNCTKIVYNAVSEEAIALRNRMNEVLESPTQGLTQLQENGSVGIEPDFLQVTKRKTIEELKDCNEEGNYVVWGTVTHVIEEDDWWYNACGCGKSVYPDHKMYFCEKCDKHVIKVEPRFRIKLRVIDHTDCTTFVIWDRDARVLFRKTCTEMFEANNMGAGQHNLPREISELLDRSFLFKVGSRVPSKMSMNCKWEQSFNEKRLCYDEVIISKFNEIYNKEDETSENVYIDGGSKRIIDAADTQISQNLLNKFSTTDVGEGSQSGVGEGVDLSKDTEDFTPPLKRVSPNEKNHDQLEQQSKISKKNDAELEQAFKVPKTVKHTVENPPKIGNKNIVDLEVAPKIANKDVVDLEVPANISQMEEPLKVLKKKIKQEKQ